MFRFFLFLLFILVFFSGYSQENGDTVSANEIEQTIEKPPVFQGCDSNASNDALRNCMAIGIQNFVSENFDFKLANSLGLKPGTYKIYVQFKIDSTGHTSVSKVKAPHQKLEVEVTRIVENMPKMKPGNQRGEPVEVLYALPITFNVDATKK